LNKATGYDGVISHLQNGVDHWVAWFPEQIKSSTGNSGKFDTNNPDIRFSISADPLGFYSAVEKSIDDSKQPVNTKEGWLKWLRNIPGIKAEEIQWIGLDDLPEGKITKDKLLEFVRANNVQVQEVMKGDKKPTEAEMRDPDYVMPEHSNATKFEQYQLPGGENYRELLLTLPIKTPETPEVKWTQRVAGEWNAEVNGRKFQMLQETDGIYVHEEGGVLGQTVRTFEDAKQRVKDAVKKTAEAGFQSSHFSEPNILAHVRFNEGTDTDGKRVLFIEEVQSDWHQKGKKEGYREENKIISDEVWDKAELLENDYQYFKQIPGMGLLNVGKGVVSDKQESNDDLRRFFISKN